MKQSKHSSVSTGESSLPKRTRSVRGSVSVRTWPATGKAIPHELPPHRSLWRTIKTPAVIAFVLLVAGGIAGIAYTSARGTVIQDAAVNTPKIELNVSKAVDSPIGFLPGFETLKNGKVRLVIDGVSVAPRIEKEVAFYVQNNGSVAYDMLPDDPGVADLLTYLTQKDGKSTYDADKNGASRFMKLDFLSLFNLHSLVSAYPDLYNGLLTAYLQNTTVKGASGQLRPARELEGCSNNAKKLQGLLDDTALNTQQLAMTNMVQSTDATGNATLTFTVEPGFFADIDTTVKNFISDCYINENTDATDKSLLEQAIKNYTTHPTYTFTVRVAAKGSRTVIVEAAYANPDLQKSIAPVRFEFELIDTTAPDSAVIGAVRSFFERPNLYALSYSYCRVPPLVGRITADAKLLLTRPNSSEYKAPSTYDMVYACTSKDQRLADYTVLPNDTWKVDGKTIRLNPEAAALALKQHDIAVAIELYFEKNSHYPSIESMQAGQLAGLKTEDLQDANGKLINNGDISYGVLPENCSECIEYSLGYKINGIAELVMKDYAHQNKSW